MYQCAHLHCAAWGGCSVNSVQVTYCTNGKYWFHLCQCHVTHFDPISYARWPRCCIVSLPRESSQKTHLTCEGRLGRFTQQEDSCVTGKRRYRRQRREGLDDWRPGRLDTSAVGDKGHREDKDTALCRGREWTCSEPVSELEKERERKYGSRFFSGGE